MNHFIVKQNYMYDILFDSQARVQGLLFLAKS